MYIGSKNCPYCRSFSPVLSDFSKTTNQPIYYLDREDSFNNLTDDEWQNVYNLFAVINFDGMPYVGLFRNGLLSSVSTDTTTIEELIAMDKLLN